MPCSALQPLSNPSRPQMTLLSCLLAGCLQLGKYTAKSVYLYQAKSPDIKILGRHDWTRTNDPYHVKVVL